MKLSLERAVGIASATVFAIFVIAVSVGYAGTIHFGIPGVVEFGMDGGGLPHVHLVESKEEATLPPPDF